jgi:hypothetical protein
MKKEKTEHSATVLAYVPGGIDLLKEMLQPVKEAQKNQALRLLGQQTKNNYNVTGFGISIADKESINLIISRVDGDEIYTVDLHLEALSEKTD